MSIDTKLTEEQVAYIVGLTEEIMKKDPDNELVQKNCKMFIEITKSKLETKSE